MATGASTDKINDAVQLVICRPISN